MATPKPFGNKYFLPDPSDLPQLKMQNGYTIPFAQLIVIDVENLEQEYETHAAWQATIGYAHAQASVAVARCERELERMEARKFFDCRIALENVGVVKPTVDAVKNKVALDPEVIELQDKLLELEHTEKVLDTARRSFESRKDMLVNLGAHQRADKVKVFQKLD